MSDFCDRDRERERESLEFKSLVFNAGNINDGVEVDPDTVQLGAADSGFRILGWLLDQGDTDEYSLYFNVPRDAFNKSRKTKVFVHLLTDNFGKPGNRFAIRLSSLFTRANGVVNADNIQINNSGNIQVQNSGASFRYSHYVIEFCLDDIVRAEDFALLSVARVAIPGDFTGELLLTSIEFRYLSCEA